MFRHRRESLDLARAEGNSVEPKLPCVMNEQLTDSRSREAPSLRLEDGGHSDDPMERIRWSCGPS